MRSGAKLSAAVAAVALLASCSSGIGEQMTEVQKAAGAVGDARDLLFTEQGADLSVVDASTGDQVFEISEAVTSPDHSRLYSEKRRADQAFVSMLDSSTGTRLGRMRVGEHLEPRVASTSGDLLALAEPHQAGATPWLPAGRRRSEIAVVSTGDGAIRSYDLKGNFEIEAFSTDDRQLFLLEYRPALNPTRYTLRRLKLGSGDVVPIKRSKQNAPGSMLGTGRVALFSPSGHELYTLYTQQGPNYAHGDDGTHEHDAGAVHAFIHLLNLEGAWTHCIDLPMPFGTGAVTTHALAMSADGTRLYVADPSSGGVAIIDPAQAKVLGSTTMDLDALTKGDESAQVGSDGRLYLAGGTQVLALDGRTLEAVERWEIGERVSGLAVSSDGTRLYLAIRNRVKVVDSTTGAGIEVIRARGITGISHLSPTR
ncbi:MAG: YncE family protein [Actinomycetota bacterium]